MWGSTGSPVPDGGGWHARRSLWSGSGGLGRGLWKLGHKVRGHLRGSETRSGMERPWRFSCPDIHKAGRNETKNYLRLHGYRRTLHEPGIPLLQGAVCAGRAGHKGQQWQSSGLYPETDKEQPWRGIFVHAGRGYRKKPTSATPVTGRRRAGLLPFPKGWRAGLWWKFLYWPDGRKTGADIQKGAARVWVENKRL